MSCVKRTLTIRLDQALEREFHSLALETGRTRSDLARDALRRQLTVLRFERRAARFFHWRKRRVCSRMMTCSPRSLEGVPRRESPRERTRSSLAGPTSSGTSSGGL